MAPPKKEEMEDLREILSVLERTEELAGEYFNSVQVSIRGKAEDKSELNSPIEPGRRKLLSQIVSLNEKMEILGVIGFSNEYLKPQEIRSVG